MIDWEKLVAWSCMLLFSLCIWIFGIKGLLKFLNVFVGLIK